MLCCVLRVSCLPQVPVALVQEVLQARGGEGSADLQSKYDRFAMRSFVEDNRALVWCTGGWWCFCVLVGGGRAVSCCVVLWHVFTKMTGSVHVVWRQTASHPATWPTPPIC